MSAVDALVDELVNDPLPRGYASMDFATMKTSLTTVDRTRNKTSLSGDEVFNAADPTEYNGLSDAAKSQFIAFCGRDAIDPFAANNVALMTNMFGGGSTTVTNLQTLRTESVSRAQEIGAGECTDGALEQARAISGVGV